MSAMAEARGLRPQRIEAYDRLMTELVLRAQALEEAGEELTLERARELVDQLLPEEREVRNFLAYQLRFWAQ